MMDWPMVSLPTPDVLFSLHPDALGSIISNNVSGGSSGAFAANECFYVPFVIRHPSTAVKMSYIVGATASGNVDLGIYDSQKNRLVQSGSTAQGSINTIQELDITDTLLLPGLYLMALTGSSGTGTWFRATTTDELAQSQIPLYTETTGAFGLPATAAFASTTAGTVTSVPIFAVHFDTLV